jgi:hypothetical protein
MIRLYRSQHRAVKVGAHCALLAEFVEVCRALAEDNLLGGRHAIPSSVHR